MSLVLKIVAFVIDKLDPKGLATDDRDYDYPFSAPLASAKAGADESTYIDNVERMRREI